MSWTTAWRQIKSVMAAAGIKGPQATAKGLRDGFAVCHTPEPSVPLNVIQRWMGHAHIRTTAIYLQVVGEEERRLVARLWGVAGD